jgi:hypothetical protein
MGLIHEEKAYGLTIRESANDGSDFTNPDADYRRLFLGEDGFLHVRDSSGTVTDAYDSGGGAGTVGVLPIAVGSGTQTSSASTIAATISAASSGNLLIATVSGIGTANVTGIASTNTTWTVLHSSTAGTSPKAEIWKGVVAGGSSGTTVTATFSANNSDRSIVVSEWNGFAGTLDQSAMRAGVANAATLYYQSSPAILPTDANALVIGCVATTNGTQRFGGCVGLVGFEPFLLNTSSLAGYQGSYYGFPGEVPINVQTFGPNTGTYSATIVSIT